MNTIIIFLLLSLVMAAGSIVHSRYYIKRAKKAKSDSEYYHLIGRAWVFILFLVYIIFAAGLFINMTYAEIL